MTALPFRPRFWPTVITAPALIVLIGLGIWQLDRMQWKADLIAQRQAAAAAAPVALPADGAPVAGLAFRKVVAEGVFEHDKELYLAATSQRGNSGWQVLTPLRLADGSALLVSRGWVPEVRKDPASRAAGQVAGSQRVEGLLRVPPPGKPGYLVPDNRPDLNIWFWVDVPAMATAAGAARLRPYYVDAGPAPNPGGLPIGGQTRLALPNDHLQYALTWFALAAALAVIFIVYHRRADGETPPTSTDAEMT